MPLTHTRRFRVRHYECDLYGLVNPSNYVRYMQETAFDASAAVGYPLDLYATIDRYWLVHDTEVEYLGPLHYGDTVEVTTWVVDFRHVRSLRAYELHKAGTGELVARGHTDWVFMNTVTSKPAPIPLEMAAAFAPEGVARREQFPSMPPPLSGVFKVQRRVEWRDLDPGQHVNNAAYLSYVEDCGVQAAEAHGWPAARMAAEGVVTVTRRQRIEYLQQAILDDELELATWLADVEHSSAVQNVVITRIHDRELVARARILWEWVDVATGQSAPIPAVFREALASDQVS
ncbi:MAG: YbgC/FadM family acyl-CoA thioesterase [Anaerolineae bacterium]|nr:YbgC/FadM family acyl-CoA thioesterase [Anaerolineae bacterium]